MTFPEIQKQLEYISFSKAVYVCKIHFSFLSGIKVSFGVIDPSLGFRFDDLGVPRCRKAATCFV